MASGAGWRGRRYRAGSSPGLIVITLTNCLYTAVRCCRSRAAPPSRHLEEVWYMLFLAWDGDDTWKYMGTEGISSWELLDGDRVSVGSNRFNVKN